MAAYWTYAPWAVNALTVLGAWRYAPLTVIRLMAAFTRDEQHRQRCMDVLRVSRLSFHSSRTANSERDVVAGPRNHEPVGAGQESPAGDYSN